MRRSTEPGWKQRRTEMDTAMGKKASQFLRSNFVGYLHLHQTDAQSAYQGSHIIVFYPFPSLHRVALATLNLSFCFRKNLKPLPFETALSFPFTFLVHTSSVHSLPFHAPSFTFLIVLCFLQHHLSISIYLRNYLSFSMFTLEISARLADFICWQSMGKKAVVSRP